MISHNYYIKKRFVVCAKINGTKRRLQVEIIKKIHVDGEVNRARCMPQKPSVIAAKTSACEVYVFDSSKHPTDQDKSSCAPDLKLKGHDKEGYGLSWSPFKEGHLLSGSNDCRICLWDTSATSVDKVLEASNVYEVNINYCFFFLFNHMLSYKCFLIWDCVVAHHTII